MAVTVAVTTTACCHRISKRLTTHTIHSQTYYAVRRIIYASTAICFARMLVDVIVIVVVVVVLAYVANGVTNVSYVCKCWKIHSE